MEDEVKKDLENLLEKKKKDLDDYLRIAAILEIPESEQTKRVDLLLDDITKIKKELNSL